MKTDMTAKVNVAVYVQISVLTLVIMFILAGTISWIVGSSLDHNMALLGEHGSAMMAGTAPHPSDSFSIQNMQQNVSDLQYKTYISTVGSFVAMYLGFLLIIWRGSKTLRGQRQELELRVRELTALNTARSPRRPDRRPLLSARL